MEVFKADQLWQYPHQLLTCVCILQYSPDENALVGCRIWRNARVDLLFHLVDLRHAKIQGQLFAVKLNSGCLR